MSKFYDYCCTCQHLYEECHRGPCSTCDDNACNYVNIGIKYVEKETDNMDVCKREKVLLEARNIVCSDRNKQYGEPEDNFKSIAELWSVYTGLTLTAKDVALMMTLFKIGRLMANPEKDDSWIDAAGYIACGAEIALK